MKEETRTNILNILESAIKALDSGAITELRDLSDQTIHDATIFQDDPNISIAVVLFSLFKVYEKHKNHTHKDWLEFTKKINATLEKAHKLLLQGNVLHFKECITNIYELISSYDHNFGFYVREVLEQAKLQKGSKVIEHGLSAARAAELLGVNQWELQNYVGYTKIPEIASTVSAQQRLKYARQLFK